MLYNKDWDLPKTPAEVLRRAAMLIEEHGSAKYYFRITPELQRTTLKASTQKLGSMCIQGAMIAAIGEDPNIEPHHKMQNPLLRGTMELLAKKVGYEPAIWNNSANTSQETIVMTARTLADELELVAA